MPQKLSHANVKGNINLDFALKVVKWSDDVTVKLQLWDIAGQERFTSMTRVYYRDAQACVIMFDLTQRSSFNNALKWKKDLDSKCVLPDGNPIPCMLLANKCDLPHREVEQEEIETFCRDNDFIGWTEISVKEALMVNESMRFLMDDMIARFAERNSVSRTDYLDTVKANNVRIRSSWIDDEPQKRKCAC